MKQLTAYRWVAIALLSLALLSACTPAFECTDALGCVTIAPGAPVKLGAIHDLSGGGAVFGQDQIRSLELAIEVREGQLLGHPIEVQVEDELCTAEGGANAALRITADAQVVGIFGTTCSSAAGAAAEIMSEEGLVMISGVNSAPSMTSIAGEPGEGWQPGYFRTMLNVAEESRVAAAFAFEELGARRAATIDDGDTFSLAYAAMFRQTFEELGGEIVLDATVNKGDENMQPVLNAVADAEAQAVFLSLFPPEGARIVQQARDLPGLQDLIIVGGGALRTEDFLAAAGEAAEGTYFIGSAPPPEGPASDALLEAFEAKFGEPPQTVTYGYGYDAANLLLSAIEATAQQERDGTLHIGRQALRDALYATQDFEGVMGAMTCDAFGDCAVVRFDIVRLKDAEAGVEALLSNVIFTYTQ